LIYTRVLLIMSSSCKCSGSDLSELTNAILDVAAIAVSSWALYRFINFIYEDNETPCRMARLEQRLDFLQADVNITKWKTTTILQNLSVSDGRLLEIQRKLNIPVNNNGVRIGGLTL
jgi:hypothetical protein